MMLMLI